MLFARTEEPKVKWDRDSKLVLPMNWIELNWIHSLFYIYSFFVEIIPEKLMDYSWKKDYVA